MELSEEMVLSADLATLYKILRQRKYDEIDNVEEVEDAIKKVRYGLKYKFDINDYQSESYIEKGKRGFIIIPDYKPNNKYTMPQIYDEIEAREDIARQALLNSIQDDDIVTARKE